MKTIGLAIAWNWEFDADFVVGVERECIVRDVSALEATSRNLSKILHELKMGEISFHAFYDRASDADDAFLPLVTLLDQPAIRVINSHKLVLHAIDKATMHLEFITHGLNVPFTIILPPYNMNGAVDIPMRDLDHLLKPFVIKPANTTGGGTGVVLDARTIKDVAEARTLHPDDKYLVQEFVHPRDLGGKRAWFRIYSVFGEIIPCWWDDKTHMYTVLSQNDEDQFGLSALHEIMTTIQTICKLDFFSSEVALTEEGKFVVVDYVNEICDMRLQSKYRNGAPDAVVHRIEWLIAREVASSIERTIR